MKFSRETDLLSVNEICSIQQILLVLLELKKILTLRKNNGIEKITRPLLF